MAALRKVSGQTGATLAAWGNRPDQHSIADLVTRYASAQFGDDSHWFVTNYET
jgi:hypothetical protein